MPRSSDKRERLLRSADQLILKQGFNQTTLAEIAEDSNVPLGNVYYYFRTKEAIGETVIKNRLDNLRQLLQKCSAEATPKARLVAFLNYPVTIQASLVEHGCPLGTLAYELSRMDGFLRESSRGLIKEMLDWSTEQFEQMGKTNARSLGLRFVSQLQGMSLVANTLEDPQVITDMVEQTRQWIETL
jgi:TetR/AcrR family transcriptional repressor of nem operon